MEFNAEQQAYIDDLVAKSKEGMYSQEDFQRELTREVDRRVESGIQKGLETQKGKWQAEFERKSKLTAEELAKAQLEEKLGELSTREKELATRANMLEAKSALAEADIPKDHYEKFIGLLVGDDTDTTKVNVENFINTFNETKASIEQKIKEDLAKVPSPKTNTSSGTTKKDFDKMTYAEQVKFKAEHPDLFQRFINS